MAPAEFAPPESPDQEEMLLIITSVPDHLTDEVKRTILREAEDRYRHELIDDEERMLLLDRIKRLRKSLGL